MEAESPFSMAFAEAEAAGEARSRAEAEASDDPEGGELAEWAADPADAGRAAERAAANPVRCAECG